MKTSSVFLLVVMLFVTAAWTSPGFAQMGIVSSVPSGLTAVLDTSTSSAHVDLSWSGARHAWKYWVYRAVDSASGFSLLKTTDEDHTADYSIASGHTYYYTVSTAAITDSTVIGTQTSAIASVAVGTLPVWPMGVISGTVTDSLTGLPLSLVRVTFYPGSLSATCRQLPVIPEAWTDSLGDYSATLDTGSYYIKAGPVKSTDSSTGYRSEWYSNAHSASAATAVAVGENASVTINFDLVQPATPVAVTLSGTVYDTLGAPLKNAVVFVSRTIQDMHTDASNGTQLIEDLHGRDIFSCGHMRGIVWQGLSDSLGQYTASLTSGNSYVVGATKKGYITQFYNGQTDPSDATILTLGGDTTGINFALSPVPVADDTLTGTVKDSTGAGVQARVVLFSRHTRPHAHAVRFTSTDSTGVFAFNGVPDGVYYVMAIPFDNYAPAFYKAGAYGVETWEEADSIVVAGNVSGIDIGVVAVTSTSAGTVNGKLEASDPAGALAGANVFLVNASGQVAAFGLSDQKGTFAIPAVGAGSYTLVADKPGYASATASVTVNAANASVTVSALTLSSSEATSVAETGSVPATYQLQQNYPNPFNPTTTIQYSLSVASNITLKVFNLLGEEVSTLASGYQAAGTHQVVVDGKKLASGVYFYRLEAGSYRETKRMVLLK